MQSHRPGRITAAGILSIVFGVFILLFAGCGLTAAAFRIDPDYLLLTALFLEALLALGMVMAGIGLLTGSSWGRVAMLVVASLGGLLIFAHGLHHALEVIPARMNIAPPRVGAPFDFFRVGFQRGRSAFSFAILGFFLVEFISLVVIWFLCLRPIPQTPFRYDPRDDEDLDDAWEDSHQ